MLDFLELAWISQAESILHFYYLQKIQRKHQNHQRVDPSTKYRLRSESLFKKMVIQMSMVSSPHSSVTWLSWFFMEDINVGRPYFIAGEW